MVIKRPGTAQSSNGVWRGEATSLPDGLLRRGAPPCSHHGVPDTVGLGVTRRIHRSSLARPATLVKPR